MSMEPTLTAEEQRLRANSERVAHWKRWGPYLAERQWGTVREYYYYLDATPTSSYLQFLYKYPHAAYPYDQLREENAKRTRHQPEYELIDSGVLAENRYFDVFVEYAKATFEDIVVRITAWNRGPQPARLHLLPSLWFRNRWDWGDAYNTPQVARVPGFQGGELLELTEFHYGQRWLVIQGAPEPLFTDNETNMERLFGQKSKTPYVKDAFHRYLINGEKGAVNPAMTGTKAAAHFSSEIAPGQSWTIRLRLTDQNLAENHTPASQLFGPAFDAIFEQRKKEADEFYEKRIDANLSEDARRVQRQAFAGLLWCKQSYHYDVRRWLEGDSTQPKP